MDDILLQVRSILAITPLRWAEMTRSIPVDLLTQPPAPGEWSAVQCLEHIMETEMLFNSRLVAFLEGRDFPAFNPNGGNKASSQSPEKLAARFGQMRAESLSGLEKLVSADLHRQARHAEFGMVTLGQMVNEWAGHDLMHTVQAERAMMQPFIRGCGPWQVYFSDHFVKPA